MCRARGPLFSPKFPLRSISFSQMTTYTTPEHHHYTFFAVPCREHHFQKCIYVKAILRRPRSAYCNQPKRKAFRERPGVSDWPEYQPCRHVLQNQFRRPPLSRSSSLWSPAFSRSSSLRSPPIFAAHTYPTPPPPPSDASRQLTNKEKKLAHFTIILGVHQKFQGVLQGVGAVHPLKKKNREWCSTPGSQGHGNRSAQ